MGNPLLDIQVKNGEELLKKYNLNPNDAILADEKHLPMLDIFVPPFLTFLMLISFPLKKNKVMMRSSRNTRWSTSPVVQRRMPLEVQLYVPHSPSCPILVLYNNILLSASTCCLQTPWSTPVASVMTILLNNSRRQTKGRVSPKRISSRRVNRQGHVPSS